MKRTICIGTADFTVKIPKPLVADDVNAYELILQAKDLPASAAFQITALRADGVTVADKGTVEGNTARYILKNNMYAIPGVLRLRVTLVTADGACLTTNELIGQVLAGNDTDALLAEDETPILTEILLDISNIKDTVDRKIAETKNYAEKQDAETLTEAKAYTDERALENSAAIQDTTNTAKEQDAATLADAKAYTDESIRQDLPIAVDLNDQSRWLTFLNKDGTQHSGNTYAVETALFSVYNLTDLEASLYQGALLMQCAVEGGVMLLLFQKPGSVKYKFVPHGGTPLLYPWIELKTAFCNAVDNLESTDTVAPLSANMGRSLKNEITEKTQAVLSETKAYTDEQAALLRNIAAQFDTLIRSGKGENSIETGFQTNSWGDNTFSEGRGTYPVDDPDLNITPDMTDEEIIALFKRQNPRKKFAINRQPAGHNEGSSNLQLGDTGHSEGAGNINTANCGHVEGQTNENYAMNGHVQGTENVLKEEAENGSVGGKSNIGKSRNGTVIGQYNEPRMDTLLEVGCGTSDTDRRNAVILKKDGTVATRHGMFDMNGKFLVPAAMTDEIGFLKAEAVKTYACGIMGTGTGAFADGTTLNRLRVSMTKADFNAISEIALPLLAFLYTNAKGETQYVTAQVLAVSARDDSGYNLDFDKNTVNFAASDIEPYQYAERLSEAVVYTASAAWTPFSETVLPQINAKAIYTEDENGLQKACLPLESQNYTDSVYTQSYADLVRNDTGVIVACGTNDTKTNRMVVKKSDFPQITTAWNKRKLRFFAADGSVAVEDIVSVAQRADGNYNINYTTNFVTWDITKATLTEKYKEIAVTGNSVYSWETKDAFLQEAKAYTDEAIQKAIIDSWEVAI